MSPFIIYALVDPRTDQWRYIGLSSKGLVRPSQHAFPSMVKKNGRSHKCQWVRSLLAQGFEYRVEVLEELATKEELNSAEIEWIAEAHRQGIDLTNTTNGGDGIFGLRHSDEAKQKMSEAHKKLPSFSEEHRKNLSEGQKRKWNSDLAPALRSLMSGKMKGKKKLPEHVEKGAAARRGQKRTPEQCLRMSLAVRPSGHKQTEETRRKIAETLKRRHENSLNAQTYRRTKEKA